MESALSIDMIDKIEITTAFQNSIDLMAFKNQQILNFNISLKDGTHLNTWSNLLSDEPLKLIQNYGDLSRSVELDNDLYNFFDRLLCTTQSLTLDSMVNFKTTLYESDIHKYKMGVESVVSYYINHGQTTHCYEVDLNIIENNKNRMEKVIIYTDYNLSRNPEMALHIFALAFPNMRLSSETSITQKPILRNRNSLVEISLDGLSSYQAEEDFDYLEKLIKYKIIYYHDLFSSRISLTTLSD